MFLTIWIWLGKMRNGEKDHSPLPQGPGEVLCPTLPMCIYVYGHTHIVYIHVHAMCLSGAYANPLGYFEGLRPHLNSFSCWQVVHAWSVPTRSWPYVDYKARVGRRAHGKEGGSGSGVSVLWVFFFCFSERAGFMLSLWRVVWQFLLKLKMQMPVIPVFPSFEEFSHKCMKRHVQGCSKQHCYAGGKSSSPQIISLFPAFLLSLCTLPL